MNTNTIIEFELKVKQLEAELVLVPSADRRRHIGKLLDLERAKLTLDTARLNVAIEENSRTNERVGQIQKELASLRNENARHQRIVSEMKAKGKQRNARIDSLLRQMEGDN